MVDYKAIADRAEGILGGVFPERFQEAFDVMKGEKEKRIIPGIFRVNRRMLMAKLGVGVADGIIQKIFVGLENSGLSADGIASIKEEINVGDGIDLNNLETIGMLQGFVGAGVLEQGELDLLLGLREEEKEKWEGLTPGIVQNALELRKMGVV